MSKATWAVAGIIIVLVIAGIGYWSFTSAYANNPAPVDNTPPVIIPPAIVPPAAEPPTTVTPPPTTTPPPASQMQYIDISNYEFSPQTITINQGDIVVWMNSDSVVHTVISNPAGMFFSANIAPGASYSYQFNTPGTFNYRCTIHPGMTGTVIVLPSNNPPPATNPPITAGETYQVKISGYSFTPKNITVNVGDTVVWTNNDAVTHTVDSSSGNELASGNITTGMRFSHTFNTAGTFTYHCGPHPNMTGSVTVIVPGGTPQTTIPQTSNYPSGSGGGYGGY